MTGHIEDQPTTWRHHLKRQIASVGFVQRAILSAFWICSLGFGVWFLMDPGLGLDTTARRTVALILALTVPLLAGLGLVIMAGSTMAYEIAKRRMPRVLNTIEVTISIAVSLGIVTVLLLAAWEKRERVGQSLVTGIGIAIGFVSLIVGGLSSGIEAMLSLRGLLRHRGGVPGAHGLHRQDDPERQR